MRIFRATFKVAPKGVNDVLYIAAKDAIEALDILHRIRHADGTPLIEHDADTPLVEYFKYVKIEEVEP